MSSQTSTVLFADLSGSTRLYEVQGDIKAHQSVSQSLQCMKAAIESHGGRLLRTVGDSALASFEEADAACDAAVLIQRKHSALQLPVRVGFHFGEVIRDSGDLYGHAVNLAARVAQYAEANEICTTGEVVARLSHRHRTNTHYLDKVDFKGVSEPLPVYRVNWKTDNAQTMIVTGVPTEKRYPNHRTLLLNANGKRLTLEGSCPTLTLGRATNNDVVIESESASRNHAFIELVRGRYVITDTSTNGTYVRKAGASAEFIRRESFSLDQFGMIGLGFDPQLEPSNAIDFRLLTGSS